MSLLLISCDLSLILICLLAYFNRYGVFILLLLVGVFMTTLTLPVLIFIQSLLTLVFIGGFSSIITMSYALFSLPVFLAYLLTGNEIFLVFAFIQINTVVSTSLYFVLTATDMLSSTYLYFFLLIKLPIFLLIIGALSLTFSLSLLTISIIIVLTLLPYLALKPAILLSSSTALIMTGNISLDLTDAATALLLAYAVVMFMLFNSISTSTLFFILVVSVLFNFPSTTIFLFKLILTSSTDVYDFFSHLVISVIPLICCLSIDRFTTIGVGGGWLLMTFLS
jgi:hypothetical protein